MNIGDKVKWVKNKEDMATYSKLSIGDVGVLCDIDSTDGLNHYVFFNAKGIGDWFYKEELELLEN